MTTLQRQPYYQPVIPGARRILYPVPATQAEMIGQILMPYGREIEWEITPNSTDTEMLSLYAHQDVHEIIFNSVYFIPRTRKRIAKQLGI